jgi:peptidoglycan/LPS O-acetylase OafA/YrhL
VSATETRRRGLSPAEGYRADVDGLRAIAVLAVIAYHAFPSIAPGGFVGVDVFFVISGFLITGIISRGISFADFYARRVRRLFPALLVTLLLSLVAGALFLLEHELVQLGEHVVAATLYVSNFQLFQESGYFDTDAALKPLQHLWSLAVEEQFYLLWPLLLVVGARRIRVVIGAVIALSFVANAVLVVENPSAGFYLPFGRLWELALGGAFAVSNVRLHRHASIVGVAMVVASCFVVDSDGFPGIQALLPTVGTAMILNAAATPRILANRHSVYVGKISYALYLFHWPLLVFPRIIVDGELSVAARIVAVVTTFVLAALSTRFVEAPLRQGGRRVVIGLLMIAVALGVLGKLVAMKVLTGRHDDVAMTPIAAALTDWSYMSGAEPFARGSETFFKKGDGESSVLFVGDSFMEQYWPGVHDVMQRRATPSVIFATKHACAPFADVEFDNHRECAGYVREMRALASEPNVKRVVVAAVWPHYWSHPFSYEQRTREEAFDEFERWLIALAREKPVTLILTNPQGSEFDPKHMLRFTGPRPSPVSRATVEAQVGPSNARLRAAAARAGVEVVDPLDFLCDSTLCPVVNAAGQPFTTDGSHLRASAVRERMTFLARLLSSM